MSFWPSNHVLAVLIHINRFEFACQKRVLDSSVLLCSGFPPSESCGQLPFSRVWPEAKKCKIGATTQQNEGVSHICTFLEFSLAFSSHVDTCESEFKIFASSTFRRRKLEKIALNCLMAFLPAGGGSSIECFVTNEVSQDDVEGCVVDQILAPLGKERLLAFHCNNIATSNNGQCCCCCFQVNGRKEREDKSIWVKQDAM